MDRQQTTVTPPDLNPPPYDSDKSSRDIRRETDRTRSAIDRTIDQLGDRLQPRHLLDDVVSWITGGSDDDAAPHAVGGASEHSSGSKSDYARRLAKGTGKGLFRQIRKHPIPAALIGAGVAYLMFDDDKPDDLKARAWYENQRNEPPMHGGSYVDARTGQPYNLDTYGSQYRGQAPSATGADASGRGWTDSAKDSVGHAADKAGSTAAGLKSSIAGAGQSARDTAGHLADKAGDLGHRAADTAGQWSDAAQDYAASGYRQSVRGLHVAGDEVGDLVNDHPVSAGLAALAAGILAGFLAPSTRREDQWFGEQADDLKHQAADLGQEVYERGKHVAVATADAAAEEARRRGVSPDQLADKLGKSAQDLKHAAGDAMGKSAEGAKREGIEPSNLAGNLKQVAKTAADTAKREAGQESTEMKEAHT